MQPMVINSKRRALLKAALSVAPASVLFTGCANLVSPQQTTIVGCSRSHQGTFGVVAATEQGKSIYRVALPERGHGIAIQPQGDLAVAFARRPGRYMQAFNHKTGEEWGIRPADPKRHYYGHGVFSSNGKLLYATEGVSGTSDGIIGVYRVEPGFPKIMEFSGFGIGPHEVVLVDDKTLAVGVGGVHTNGRAALNIETMQPALVYLSTETGDVLESVTLNDKKLSIRHLSTTSDGRILCGQQYRGEPEYGAPLVAIHRRGEKLQVLNAEPEQWLRFNHYIASISVLDGLVLATSPRGNCYGIWDLSTNMLLEINSLPDASGVGVKNSHWLVGSGTGKVLQVKSSLAASSHQTDVMWDNHWSIISS